MSQHILVVDDDARLQELLARYLTEQGYRTATASDAIAMQRLLQRQIYALYILDINLPGEDGLQICQRLRASGDTTPIIMLTARGEDVDRILGLELGADDYLAKPFNPRELLARIRSVLRRRGDVPGSAHEAEAFQIEFDGFRLDAGVREFTYQGKLLGLNPNEFALLKVLVQNAGQPFSRSQLSARVYGEDHLPDQRNIDMMISRLRKHLHQGAAAHEYIQTLRGVGYLFRMPS